MGMKINQSYVSCAKTHCATPGWPRRFMTALVTAPLFALGAFGQSADIPQEPQINQAMPQSSYVFVPESSKAQPLGFAHTNYVLHSLDGNQPKPFGASTALEPVVNSDGTVETLETPASLGCLYVGSPSITGCVPGGLSQTGGPSAAGYGAIALVDAYDNPDAASDLSAFVSQFKLPSATFTKIYANGNGDCTTPPPNTGWSLESSLDIEWAHVFAPNAVIILVEACSNSDTDLYYAEQVAFNYIIKNYPAGGQVSNSWAGGEYSGETSNDPYFADYHYGTTTHIQAFASAGDTGASVNYPSVVPWLVSAGGTSIYRNSSNDDFSSEGCWGDGTAGDEGSGGGPSEYETYATSFSGGHTGPWADYQYPIFGQAVRSTPDMSFDADPASGVPVYSQYYSSCAPPNCWYQVGGTSVSSPSLASIVNRAGNNLSTFYAFAINGKTFYHAGENDLLYAQLGSAKAYPVNFYDVKTGSNGHSAVTSYDQCTGVGSPRGLPGK